MRATYKPRKKKIVNSIFHKFLDLYNSETRFYSEHLEVARPRRRSSTTSPVRRFKLKKVTEPSLHGSKISVYLSNMRFYFCTESYNYVLHSKLNNKVCPLIIKFSN